MKAFWQSFNLTNDRSKFYGLPVNSVISTIDKVQKSLDSQEEIEFNSLDIETREVQEYKAIHYGVPSTWIDKIHENNPSQKHILQIRNISSSSPASVILEEGDLILEINGNIISSFNEICELCCNEKSVRMLLWRNNAELTVDVPTVRISGLEPRKMIQWAGAYLQDPFRELLLVHKYNYPGVFVCRYIRGSPADFYALKANCWILEINGKPTPTLDCFLNVISEIDSKSFVRISIIDVKNKKYVITLKPNTRFFPTLLFELKNGRWNRNLIQHI